MREFQERRKIKKFLHSRYAIAVLAIALVVVGRGAWGIYGKYQKSKGLAERASAELATLKEREGDLAAAIESLNTDEGREREIRDRFGAVREGERLVVLVDETSPREVRVQEEEKGFWAKFFDALGF